MANACKFTTLDALLKYCSRKKGDEKPVTHTRIGSSSLNIFGGSYHIPDDLMPLFNKLYIKKVFTLKRDEYLTELQDRKNGNPILIDLDIKYESSITTRQHSVSEITDIIELYCDTIKDIFIIDNEIAFKIFVFEKDDVVVSDNESKNNYTKDGIHILIQLQLEHNKQMLLRKYVLDKEENERGIFGENGLNCINSINDIIDESISSGRTGWQCWGSKKPGCDPYKLTYIWNITMSKDSFTNMEMENINEIDYPKYFPLLSAKNKSYQKLEVKEIFKNQLTKIQPKKTKKIIKKSNKVTDVSLINKSVNVILPSNHQQLDDIINDVMSKLPMQDSYLKELHELTMCFDETYYNPFQEWINVGWALHNTSDTLFWTWVKFSSKSDKFIWDDVPSLVTKWNTEMGPGFSFRSIHYWCKRDFPDQYEKIHKNSVDSFVYKTLPGGGTDTDIAILAKHIFMDEYSCVAIKQQKWYKFSGHRWKENDSGTSLRCALSQEIEPLYQKASQIEKDKSTDEQYSAAEREAYLHNASSFNRIGIRLKTSSAKSHVMRECMEQFYDPKLLEQLDENKYLLGFENGVYDFKKKEFRDGEPEDYISFTTGTMYIPFDTKNGDHLRIKDEIDDFFEKVFPNQDLRQYMWEHAASCLIGEQRNQKFNIYTGVGGNGKSIFVDLMNLVLGDYADKLNIALVTQKRKGIGGPTPEIAKLKGKRYISMDEPSENDVLNEGVMKQMVGGDEMEGRGCYDRKMTKFYPQFELVCCTNHLFTVKSNDKGTWRRIRQVDFASEFLDEPDYEAKKSMGLCDDPERPIYLKDDQLKNKLPHWVQVFTALLIEIVNKTGGKVNDCDKVLEASKAYQEKENFWAQFMNENIAKGTEKDKFKKTDIRNVFNEWYKNNYQTNPPKASDLYEYLDKTIGKQRARAWYGYKIIYDTYESENDSDSD